MEYWVKFYKKIQNNRIFRRDRTAWHVFEVLLINCRDGVWEGGRYQLAELCDENPNTLKDAIKRLKNAKMVTTKSTNKFTEYYIRNWERYQSKTPQDDTNTDTNKTPTKHQQNTTLIRIKNKELRILLSLEQKAEIIENLVNKGMNRELAENEINKFISYWTEKNHTGTKERWQLEKTFEVQKRLATWFSRINNYGGQSGKRGIRL